MRYDMLKLLLYFLIAKVLSMTPDTKLETTLCKYDHFIHEHSPHHLMWILIHI